MKKFLLFLLLIMVSSFFCLEKDYINFLDAKKAIVYTNKTDYFIENCKKINIDNMSAFECSFNDIYSTLSLLEDYFALEITYSHLDIDEFAKSMNAKIVDINVTNNRIFYYLYSKKVQQFTNNYHHEFNMQVSISKEQIKVGIPLLIGSC